MTRTSWCTVLAVLALAVPAAAQSNVPADAIPLSQVIVHSSPADIASWPATGAITGLHMRATATDPFHAGISIDFTTHATWPDYTPPGWDGAIEYTVWAIVKVSNQWHAAGFIQMWRDRPSTGAPILEIGPGCTVENWRCNWAYDPFRWGAMAYYVPQPGDQMGFFVTAGDARGVTTVTSVRERSNVVVVNLPASNNGDWAFAARRSTTMDFNGDGYADLAVYRPSSGLWFLRNVGLVQLGAPSDIPVPGDYNGDHITDAAVYRRATGEWFFQNQSTVAWGAPGDIPTPADFDGDGKTDIAVFRPSQGLWLIRGQGTVQYGAAGDIPVPADYLGAGSAQVALFRRGTWFVGGNDPVSFGQAGDIPVPADYDGDGKVDMAVFRPSTGTWFVRGQGQVTWGQSGDIPIPLDVFGTGYPQLVVFRPSAGWWYILDPRNGSSTAVPYGTAGDIPVAAMARPSTVGDFDGDRRTDVTVFRPTTGMWFSLSSTSGFGAMSSSAFGANGDVALSGDFLGVGYSQRAIFRSGLWFFDTGGVINWGMAGDIPLVADFDGDRAADLVIYRNGMWYILLSSTHYTSWLQFNFGTAGDVPMAGDYDGDGKADLGVFRNGTWYGLSSISNYTVMVTGSFGIPGDVPLRGDFDGDGILDIAVYRPSNGTWWVRQSTDGAIVVQNFGGVAGDIPAPGDYDGDGKTDIAIFRPSAGTWYVLSQFGVTFGTSGDVPIPRAQQ